MHATTAFNKLLAIPGADVTGVQFEPSGIVVVLRRRDRRLRCRAAGPPDREAAAEAAELRAELERLVAAVAPWLLELPGVGPISAAQVLVSWSYAGRLRS